MPCVPPALVPRLLTGAQAVAYAPGDVVLRPGQQRAPSLLASGLLRVVIQSTDGRAATISYFGPGRLFGVTSLFHRSPVFLTAHEPSTVVHLEPAEVVRLGHENAEFSWALLKAVSDNSIAIPDVAAKFVFKTVRQRVADHLLWSITHKPGEQGDLVFRTTQQEIADAVGSVREVVARALRSLQAKGLIRLSPAGVLILDQKGLIDQSV